MAIDERLKPYRGVVLVFAVFLFIVALSAAVLFVLKLGLSSASVAEYYRGSEERFLRPKSLGGLLKIAVPHLIAAPLALFTTVHLVGYVGLVRLRPFALLSRLTFGAVLLSVVAGFAIRYGWPQLALLKVAAFLGLEALLLLWLGLLGAAFWPEGERAGRRLSAGARS